MSFENRKWVILTSSEAENIDFSKVCETNRDSMRWTNDGSKCFVKYDGNKPSFLSGKSTLNHSQMATELEKEEWNGES